MLCFPSVQDAQSIPTLSLNWICHLKASLLLLEIMIPIGPTTRQFSNKAGPGIWEHWLFPLLPGTSFRETEKAWNPCPRQSPKQYTFLNKQTKSKQQNNRQHKTQHITVH